MKKIFSLLLILCLVFLTLSPAALASGGVYTVTAQVAAVYSAPDIFSDKIGEVFKGTLLNCTQTEGIFAFVFLPSAGISGWVELRALSEYSSDAPQDEFVSLSVSGPTKTEYIEGESFDVSTITVYGILNDGSQRELKGYSVYCGNMNTPGVKTVLVSYKNLSTSFSISVLRVPLSELKISTLPDKLVYKEHERLTLAGLTLIASYSDGREDSRFTLDDILTNPDFTISSCCAEGEGSVLESGQHTIEISYKYEDIKALFTIDVTPRKLISLSIVSPPSSLVTYSKSELPSIAGLVLQAQYDNGENEEIGDSLCRVVCEPSQFVLGEGNEVLVYFGSLFVSLNYRLAILEITGISLRLPSVLTFIQGENTDLSALRVYYVYSDGSIDLADAYEMTEIDPYLSGTQNIIVRCGEYSDVFSVYISPYYRKGDVSGDGEITAEDARLALRAAVGLTRLAGSAFTAGDADRDGSITSADARLILRAAVGLEDFLKKQ